MNQNPMVFFAYDILKDQPEFAEQFLQHAEIDYYKKGDLVDSPETEEMQRLHLILEGEVECCHVLEGHINKIDMIASAGAFIGMSALDSYTRHHSFICRTNCMIASQPKTAIFDWDKEMLISLITAQTHKMRIFIQQTIDCYLSSAGRQLLYLLLEMGGKPRFAGRKELPVMLEVSQKTIADILGISRVQVMNLLKNMEADHIIETRGKQIGFYTSDLEEALRKE